MEPLPITIQHVTFRPDELIEITYCENAEVSDTVVVVKTIIISSALLDKDELLETMENLASFVDTGLLKLRNPNSTVG